MAKKSVQSLDERLKNRFSSSNKGSNKEVEKLKAELEDLKSKGKLLVRYDEVKPSEQTRQTFTKPQIAKRKRSLLAFGQLASLILIKDRSSGELLIEDGELTWRAVNEIVAEDPESNLVNLKAEMSDSENSQEARSRSLLHHQTYEGLNCLDRAESVLIQLEEMTGFQPNDIVKALRNIGYQLRKHDELVKSLELYLEYGEQDSTLEDHFSEFQILCLETVQLYQVDLHSYISGDLAYIYLEKELKNAIRTRNLPPSHALIIHRISPKRLDLDEATLIELRETVIAKTIEERLSKKEVIEEVKAILDHYVVSTEKEANIKKETKASYKIVKVELKKMSIETLNKKDLTSLESLLEKKLAKVKAALA